MKPGNNSMIIIYYSLGGPRMAEIQLLLTQKPIVESPQNYQEYKKYNSYYKPKAGEIESVIQADNEDKQKNKK